MQISLFLQFVIQLFLGLRFYWVTCWCNQIIQMFMSFINSTKKSVGNKSLCSVEMRFLIESYFLHYRIVLCHKFDFTDLLFLDLFFVTYFFDICTIFSNFSSTIEVYNHVLINNFYIHQVMAIPVISHS